MQEEEKNTCEDCNCVWCALYGTDFKSCRRKEDYKHDTHLK